MLELSDSEVVRFERMVGRSRYAEETPVLWSC